MPDWPASIRERLAGLSVDPAREASIVEEIAQHLNDRYEELLEKGVEPEAARASVLGELAGEGLLSGLRSALPLPRPAPPPGGDEPGGVFAGLWRHESPKSASTPARRSLRSPCSSRPPSRDGNHLEVRIW